MIKLVLDKTESTTNYYNLSIDGTLLKKARAFCSNINPDPSYDITSQDSASSEIILNHSLSVLPRLNYMSLKYRFDWSEIFNSISIWPSRDNKHNLVFLAEPDLGKWNNIFSFSEYCAELSTAIDTSANRDITFKQYNNDLPFVTTIEINYPLSGQVPIINVVKKLSDFMRQFNAYAMSSLSTRIRTDSILMHFDFPDDVRVPCEQYLLYFVQFLSDLGVKAVSELKHEAGYDLFTVRPEEKKDALDKIRLALEIYLRLPENPSRNLSSSGNIALDRLIANIHHLKGQLALSQALLEVKDATIQAQRATIMRQNTLLDGNVLSAASKLTACSLQEKEDLLGGILSITKYQGKGFEINLPEVFRKLKKLFESDKGDDDADC